MKIENLYDWKIFISVAQNKNFSQAARDLKISVSLVSKRISGLEEKLNIRLFQRTTRSTSLTNEGKALLPKVLSILEDLNELETSFDNQNEVSGTIKMTSIPFVANHLLKPIMSKFIQQYPRIKFEVDLTESFKDLIKDGYDLAIRIETPKDSDLIYRKLVPNQLILCATHEYLNNAPQIKRPNDLKNHPILSMNIHEGCRFTSDSTSLRDYIKIRHFSSNNGDFLTAMALENHGVLIRSIIDIKKHLESKELIRVLENYSLNHFGHLYAVIPSRRFLAPRVRLFLDFLISEIQKIASHYQ